MIVLVQVTPLAIEKISWRYFLIFVICDVIYVIGFYFFYPETKGKMLEEIEAVFGDDLAETIEEAGRRAHTDKTVIEIEHREAA